LPVAVAQDSASSGSYVQNADIITIQNKADELFEKGKYQRAYTIYLNDLAPIGDKFAQYMVGFMTLNGLVAKENPVLASAWFRLAAERDTAQFIKVRDDLNRQLDSVEMESSDQIYLRLRRQFSDVAVRMREVRMCHAELRGGSTGTRTNTTSYPITLVKPREGATISMDAYNEQVTRDMQKALDFIVATLKIEPIDAEIDEARINELEEQVTAYLARVDDR